MIEPGMLILPAEVFMPKQTLKLVLQAEPLRLRMSERSEFNLSLTATNQGKRTIDPQLHRAQLLVNNEESKVWSLAIGNGKREARWSALPPGETVSMTWSSMGESLLPRPGLYTLSLRLDQIQLPPIQVHILPEPV
jgi:hypothetical protein